MKAFFEFRLAKRLSYNRPAAPEHCIQRLHRISRNKHEILRVSVRGRFRVASLALRLVAECPSIIFQVYFKVYAMITNLCSDKRNYFT